MCTGNAFWGCERNAAGSGNIINPIMSARVRSTESFAFKYGRVEIRAQLPKGDWLWPAIWMLPKDNFYGDWPSSGEIDIMESRGNPNTCDVGGVNTFGSTLHYGPNWLQDAWDKAHADYVTPKGQPDLSSGFHNYGLEWYKDGLKTTIDGKTVLDVPFDKSMFIQGKFDNKFFNPWKYETENSAPFNQEFYFIFNVAVGGVNGYFPDNKCDKPYRNDDSHSVNAFYNAKDKWYPTWKPTTNASAMKIDYVRVW